MSAISPNKRYLSLLLVTVISLLIPSALPISQASSASDAPAHPAPLAGSNANPEQIQRARVSDALAKLPLCFEPCVDQTYPEAKFFARGSNYRVSVAPTEAVIELPLAAAAAPRAARSLRPAGVARSAYHPLLGP